MNAGKQDALSFLWFSSSSRCLWFVSDRRWSSLYYFYAVHCQISSIKTPRRWIYIYMTTLVGNAIPVRSSDQNPNGHYVSAKYGTWLTRIVALGRALEPVSWKYEVWNRRHEQHSEDGGKTLNRCIREGLRIVLVRHWTGRPVSWYPRFPSTVEEALLLRGWRIIAHSLRLHLERAKQTISIPTHLWAIHA